MSKIDKMPLKEIVKGMSVILNQRDIGYFFDDQIIIEELENLYIAGDSRTLVEKLYEYENKLDKEKFIFSLYLNFKTNLEKITCRINQIKINIIPQNIGEYDRLLKEEELHIKSMKRISELGKYTDVYNVEYVAQGFEEVEIISSKEIFCKQRFSDKKKLERWNEIDNELGLNGDGSEFILQFLLLTDLGVLFPDKKIGYIIRLEILDNALVSSGKYTFEELEQIRKEDYLKYEEIVQKTQPSEFLNEFREKIIKHIRFIDIDELLLLAGYRIEEFLENYVINENDVEVGINVIKYIKEKVADRRIKINAKIEDKDTMDEKQIKYSYSDLEECTKRFINGSYIKKIDILKIRQKVLTGDTSLEDIDGTMFNFLNLTKIELEDIMQYSLINFIYGVHILNLSESTIVDKLICFPNLISLELINYLYDEKNIGIAAIIKLYNEKLIDPEFFKEFSEENDISSEISIQKIQEIYLRIKENKESKEDEIIELDTIIEFYKTLNLEGKSEDEIEEESNDIMYQLAENFEEEDILFYYEKGLITLQTVAEWGGESIIEKLYDERKITFEDLDNSNIPIQIKKSILGRSIIENVEEYEIDKLLEYIYKGYLSEENIIRIYELAILNETYAEEMLNRGVISVPTYLRITSIKKEILEKQAETKISEVISMDVRSFSLNLVEDEMEESNISIECIPGSKKENREKVQDDYNNNYNVSTRTYETLIDPNIRWEFLKALRCKLPKDKDLVNDDPNNPFHNYEFFVIEGKDDKDIEKDSIVIGERFFKDKEKEGDFATSNATYVWQYKDYLVARRILKNEKEINKRAVLKETEGVVYVANHRPGSWAVSLLYKIAQAKAGESFEKYKGTDKGATKVIEQLEKLYTPEELNRILDLAKIIDDEQKVIREDGKEIGIVYDVISEDRRIVNHNGDER